jgi:putative ABC transport system permease protein
MEGPSFFENLLQDIRYAGRTLRRSPGFMATAIVALALGIGANTAIFTVINTVLLQPLSYPEPDRIVQLMRHMQEGDSPGTSVPKFMVWRQRTEVFQNVGVYDFEGPGINLTGGDRPEQVKGIHVSAGYFGVFGAPMEMGRAFTEDEDRPGGPKVAVIGNGLWRNRYGGDRNIVGKTIPLGNEPYTVVGVLGRSFNTDPPAEIWLPLQADPNSIDQAHYLQAAARLKPGVTLQRAQTAMKLAAEEFRQKFPDKLDAHESATAEPLRDIVVGDVRVALLILLGAVGLVLLIACANVANLLLARATIRKREIALRAALGAGRGRIISQLLTESLILSFAGGVLGLVLGYWGVRALLAINPGDIPRIGEHAAAVSLDWRVLAFTLGVSVATGALFGILPAFSAARTDLNVTLKESGSRAGTGLRHNKARSILVVTEMALALVLLVGAALLIRTFSVLRTVNPGFNAHNVLTMQMSLSGGRFENTAASNQVVREAERRIAGLPGAEAIAVSCCVPLQGGLDLPFTIAGRAPTEGPYNGDVQWRDVSPKYFAVFQIPLIRGRAFTDADDAGSSHVVVINEAMAKKFWPNADPLGEVITIGKGIGPEFEEPSRQIIGIVASVRETGLNEEPSEVMYVPMAQVNDGMIALQNRVLPLTWAVRTAAQPYSLSAAVQRELLTASGGLPVAHIRSMDEVVVESTARQNFNMTLLTIFAGVALLLAAIGIYGLMAYSVQQRTQEIGIRMALGATAENVRKMVVAQGMGLALIGVVVGAAGALALTRLMASLLYGVKAWDPVVMVSAAVLLSAVALLATYVPARRASRVDPIVSLRYE